MHLVPSLIIVPDCSFSFETFQYVLTFMPSQQNSTLVHAFPSESIN